MKNLILLHGWGSDRTYWNDFPQIDQLKTHAWSLPGFGDEPLVNNEWGIPDYAAWVKEKIENEDLENVVLLGHSFGGRVASLIASENPAWLAGLILDGAPCIYRPPLKVKLKILLAKVMKKLGIQPKVIPNPSLVRAEQRGLGGVFRKAVSFDQTKFLPQIQVPTLLIWGEQDDIVPLRIAHEVNTLIPQSNLVVIPQAGHHTFQDNSDLFYKTVRKFLAV